MHGYIVDVFSERCILRIWCISHLNDSPFESIDSNWPSGVYSNLPLRLQLVWI